MDQEAIIADIEARARRLNIPMYSLCEMAGVNNATVSKWKAGADAKISTVKKLLDQLDNLEGQSA